MPIYEYKCPSCGDVFEQMRPMSQATNPAACPSCKAESPRTVSRLARAGSGGEGGGDDLGLGGSDFGGGDFGGGDFGGHGHSH
jgi:putative FmdB family regulatory protein